ncbi:unnamed protein product [Rhizophagus irregularis]|nr:unnamed protein product [Rhizophagus irregularis]
MFRIHTDASLAKIHSEKTSAEGYIVNYYEDTIADNIDKNLNQDDNKMEKADNSESDEISKAADLVNICNINIFNSGDDDNLIIKQSKCKLDIKILVSQRRKHEAYSSQRMERIQVTQKFQTDCSELNFNPNNVNNIIALNQNNGARSGILRVKRWQSRNRLETLERIPHAPALPRICIANITPEDPTKSGGYAFALLGSKFYLVRFLTMYHQSSNYHFYVDDNITCIDSLSYISVCVYEEREIAKHVKKIWDLL